MVKKTPKRRTRDTVVKHQPLTSGAKVFATADEALAAARAQMKLEGLVIKTTAMKKVGASLTITVTTTGSDPITETLDLEELEAFANRSASSLDESGLDSVDPTTHPSTSAEFFRRIIAAREALKDAESELRDAVAAAREGGDSWTSIGAAMGTTKQGAYQRFGR